MPQATLIQWSLVRESLRKPYPVTMPMVALALLVPLYVFIPQLATTTPIVLLHARRLDLRLISRA